MVTPGIGSGRSVPQYDSLDIALAARVITPDLDEPATLTVSLSDEELLAIEGIRHRQLDPLH